MATVPPRRRRPRPDVKRRQVDLKYSDWNDDQVYDAPYGEASSPSRPSRRPPSRSSGPVGAGTPPSGRSRPPQNRPPRPKKQVEARLDDNYSDFYADEASTGPVTSPTVDDGRGPGSDYEVYDRTPPLRNQGPTVPPDDDRFPADEDYDDRFGPNPYDDELEDDNSNQFDR